MKVEKVEETQDGNKAKTFSVIELKLLKYYRLLFSLNIAGAFL